MQGKHLEVEMQLPGSVFLKRFVVFGHSRDGGCAEKKNSHPAFDFDDGNWKVISIHFRFRIKIVMLTLHVCCFVTTSAKGLTITPLYCLQTFYTECWSNKCSTAPPWTADIESEKNVRLWFTSRVSYLQDDRVLVSSPPTFVSVWGSVHLLDRVLVVWSRWLGRGTWGRKNSFVSTTETQQESNLKCVFK